MPVPSGGAEVGAILSPVAAYYGRRLKRHGATPLGVDWTCVPSQELRFVQLLNVCDGQTGFSLNDLGCGYGALASFLDGRHPGRCIDYLGIDAAPAMVARGRRAFRGRADIAFACGEDSPRQADFGVASGIFNVCLDCPEPVWEGHVGRMLVRLSATSRRGFSVNFLAAHPAIAPRPGLYRTRPERWLAFCRDGLGGAVEVVTGYGLREFTLLVRRIGGR
ncbi:class I SAM-dependent methyltransferase [Aurantimonas sp. Leaf443]|uniref:class I SAM-dependent methyltransferase n=1 Tax=Aurantimonas sp. Leaf443 TaxID=1736378 RepID=UPI0006F865A7|nr:class I SAM-dependent methyltransferase [Aurantimonas sp. Leaf443]KQT85435.1 hypothetical protein ASG48_09380 [Aurantimonas sp. Leaf443]